MFLIAFAIPDFPGDLYRGGLWSHEWSLEISIGLRGVCWMVKANLLSSGSIIFYVSWFVLSNLEGENTCMSPLGLSVLPPTKTGLFLNGYGSSSKFWLVLPCVYASLIVTLESVNCLFLLISSFPPPSSNFTLAINADAFCLFYWGANFKFLDIKMTLVSFLLLSILSCERFYSLFSYL